MKIQDAVALVTGANRGLGLGFTRALLAGGARKVYAAARDPRTIELPGVEPVALDVTRDDDIAAAARAHGDVNLLINNAGIVRGGPLLAEGSLAALRAELETNAFGLLATARAFAPVLARNGGGAILDVLSVVTWVTPPHLATYSVSKAAAWSITNGLRHELRGQGTQVVAVHVGYIDTDLARNLPGAKHAPDDVARAALAGLEAGRDEVLIDELSRQVKRGLAADPAIYTVPR
ncbi:MAG TPA: SDR family oxidoreductase [Kofleriaceae bacterium]|nr:SDR family oxidoreductase [Kofleriaceae bacterium]